MHVPVGDCNVEVTSNGFKRALERITVNDSLVVRNQYVFVYLHPESEPATSNYRPTVTPGVLQEMDRSSDALHRGKLNDARKHLDKAIRTAPNNPDVLYLNGLLECTRTTFRAARQPFQRAVSIYRDARTFASRAGRSSGQTAGV